MSNNNIGKSIPIKTILLGESGVGKSCIILRFIHNLYIPNHISTILCTCTTKKIAFNNNKDLISFDIWDTAGQEKFRSISKINYRDAEVVILVYDITNEVSFNCIKEYWYPQVKEDCPENAIIALVGSKYDLVDECKVNENEAKAYAESINAIFMTTSSLSNIGIEDLFDTIGKKILSYDDFKEFVQTTKNEKLLEDFQEKEKQEKEEEEKNNNIKQKIKKNKKTKKEDRCCK